MNNLEILEEDYSKAITAFNNFIDLHEIVDGDTSFLTDVQLDEYECFQEWIVSIERDISEFTEFS